jgi:hypothetical protein
MKNRVLHPRFADAARSTPEIDHFADELSGAVPGIEPD